MRGPSGPFLRQDSSGFEGASSGYVTNGATIARMPQMRPPTYQRGGVQTVIPGGMARGRGKRISQGRLVDEEDILTVRPL